jgi:hypothetical protein
MPKPPLIDEQKQSFENKFKELIGKEPNALKEWDRQFYWTSDIPKLDHVVKLFSRKSKDKFVTLLNQLKMNYLIL